MAPYRQIRADYNRDSIVVYQAYHKEIAQPAIKAGRFVEPFSWGRMTWIKPSYLWLMARSNWGTKSRQEHILAIRIKRVGWERALSLGVLTSFEPKHTNRNQIGGANLKMPLCTCNGTLNEQFTARNWSIAPFRLASAGTLFENSPKTGS